MIGRKIRGRRISRRSLRRILRCQCSARVIHKHGSFGRGYFLDSRSAPVVEILPDYVAGRGISDLSLLVIPVERKTPAFSILDQVSVEIIDVALAGREAIICLVNGRVGDVVYRKLRAANNLRELRAIPEPVVSKCLFPILLTIGCFFSFGQSVDRVVFESLDKIRGRDRRGRFGNIPDILNRINCRPVRIQLAEFLTGNLNNPISSFISGSVSIEYSLWLPSTAP